jgi:hypothetical protein
MPEKIDWGTQAKGAGPGGSRSVERGDSSSDSERGQNPGKGVLPVDCGTLVNLTRSSHLLFRVHKLCIIKLLIYFLKHQQKFILLLLNINKKLKEV